VTRAARKTPLNMDCCGRVYSFTGTRPHRFLADARDNASTGTRPTIRERVQRVSSDTAAIQSLAHAGQPRNGPVHRVRGHVYLIFRCSRLPKHGEEEKTAASRRAPDNYTVDFGKTSIYLFDSMTANPRGQWRDGQAGCAPICPTRARLATPSGISLLPRKDLHKFGHRNELIEIATKIFLRFWRRGSRSQPSRTQPRLRTSICSTALRMCPRPQRKHEHHQTCGGGRLLTPYQKPAGAEAHQGAVEAWPGHRDKLRAAR